MGILTHIETDTGANANIATAAAIGAYTATADKLVMCDISIDQVAGNGDYVMYLTRQIGGAGSAYVILPKTTMAAASGEAAISAQSGWITVRNGDVLTVYVDGLAGDTATPDWSTRWFEMAGVTAAVIADAVLDEALSGHTSAGSAGKAVGDILADTGTDGVVIGVAQTVATVTTLTNLPAITSDWLTAAGVKADAVTKIQNGLATPTDVVTSIAISSTVANAVSTGALAIEAGYTFRQTVTSTLAQDLGAATKLWLAIKKLGDADAYSAIYIEKTGGLTVVNGAAYTTTANGSLTVTGSSGAWSIAIHIDEAATALLFGKNTGYSAGLKAKIGNDEIAVWEGANNCAIVDGIVRTIE